MRSVNPKAEVHVVWLNAWFDPTRERGKLAVAYHSDMRRIAPDAQIVAVTHQWGDYCTRRAQGVQGKISR